MSRDALEQLRRDVVAERFHRTPAEPAPPLPAGTTYPLELANHDGSTTVWWFPVVHEPGDTPLVQAHRRQLLDSAAARMARGPR